MKKMISVLLCTLILVSLLQFPALAAVNTISASKVDVCLEKTVELTVSINNNPGFCYLKIGFSYNRDALELTEIVNGKVCTDTFTPAEKFLLWDSEQDVAENGTLVTFRFTAKETAGKFPVTLRVVECYNYQEQPVTLTVSNGSVNVLAEHMWNNGEIATVPTCKDPGVKTFVCTVCGDSKTETVEKDANNHTGGTEIRDAVSATCGKDDYTGDTYCKGCGVKLSSGTAIPATGKHTWIGGEVTTIPTCKDTGVKTFICTVCGDTKTETVDKDANNHTGGTEIRDAVSATCGKDGYTGDTYCKGCGVKISSGTAIPATGKHSWNDGEVTTAATCIAEGEKTYTCTVCRVTKTEVMAKAAHKLTKTEAKPATCTEAGNIAYYTCSVCEKTFSDAEGTKEVSDVTVAPAGHSFGEWTVTKEATVTEEGTETRTCSKCGEKETRQTERLPLLYMLGDVDFDENITAADARLALRRSVGLEAYEEGSPEYLACDVDFDGNVTAADARLILRASVGLEDPKTWG